MSNSLMQCSKKGCTARRFMDEDKCFDHAAEPSVFFKAWFAFCTLLSLALIAFGVWVVIELVSWVTAQ